ncbi:MAG: thioesterase [Chitinophagia bacterium]|nr:thioesterase [Chitinophagia bacterium]
MSRVKINFPEGKPLYTTILPVRIGDVNYGGHLGNDAVLALLHEARLQWLVAGGFSEMNVGGCGMIMGDAMIAYRGEAFYGDELNIRIYAGELGNSSFQLLYRVTTQRSGQEKEIAHVQTGMVCFNYETRKTTGIPAIFRTYLNTKP